MLSIASIGNPSYYLDLATEDYYVNGGEPPGRWAGRGAEMFTLTSGSKVARDHLRAILDGLSPGSPAISLVQRQAGRNRQSGWDLCFSAPKSVSVLWSQSGREIRSAIQSANEIAVRRVLGYLEQQCLVTRTGAGGRNRELAKGGFFALFEHGTSRAHDPQLHTHVLVSNLCACQDGKFRTLWSLDLYQYKMTLGALYRAELAHQLEQLIGLEVYRPTRTIEEMGETFEEPEGWFEIKGVSEKAVKSFSSRAEQIRALAEEYGWSSAEVKAHIAETTRERKGHINREESFAIWQEQGARAGFGPRQAEKLVASLREKQPLGPDEYQNTRLAILGRVKERLDNEVAYFEERHFVRAIAEECQGKGFGLDDVESMAEVLREELIKLEHPDSLRPYYTTPEMHAIEKGVIEQAAELAGRAYHRVDGWCIEEAIEETNDELQREHGENARLSDEQLKVLYHVVENPSALAIVQGLAGTGKTSVLKAANLAWTRAGYNVIGLAVSGQAALNLEQSTGIKSASLYKTLSMLNRGVRQEVADALGNIAKVARYNLSTSMKYPWLSPLKMKGFNPATPERLSLGKNTIVVADEASMVNTREWAELQGHVAHKHAKLVPVGDRHQLQSIGAGGPFNSLLDRHEHVSLTSIQRQRHQWMREAITYLVEGDVDHAISLYAENDALNVAANKKEAISHLVADWQKGHTEKLSRTIVMTSTREEAAQVNAAIQSLRRVAGAIRIGGLKNRLGQSLCTHDRVLFTRNHRGMGVVNGDTGTIVNIERPRGIMGPGKMHVRLDRERESGLFTSILPFAKNWNVVTVDLMHYPDIELGYATTTHKMQGGTVDKAFVLGSDIMQNREQTYTQLSRVREDVQIYLTESEAGEGLSNFVRNVGLSEEKNLAHDVGLTDKERFDREHREQAERDFELARRHINRGMEL